MIDASKVLKLSDRGILLQDKETLNLFLNLKPDDITKSFLINNFGEFNSKKKYNHWDMIEIPIGTYKNNKNKFITTLGLWCFNKKMFEKDLFPVVGYINKEIDDDEWGNINKIVSRAVLEQRTSLQSLKSLSENAQLMMRLVTILSPNFNENMMIIDDLIKDKKKAILDKYAERLDKGDEIASAEVEKELLAAAKEVLKDDESMDIYLSGARGSFGNNFKNLFLFKGAVFEDGKFKILKSNYMNGISKQDYATHANSLVAGPMGRAIKTANGGYIEKLMVSAYQHVLVDPLGSDCGTKKTMPITLTKNNIEMYLYSYIANNDGSFTEITSSNIDSFIGKSVNVRFSSMCESKGNICNRCAGNMFYRLGITNVGILCSTPASTIKNKSMKVRHAS